MQWAFPRKCCKAHSFSGLKGKQQLARDMLTLTILNTHTIPRHLEAVNALLAVEPGQVVCYLFRHLLRYSFFLYNFVTDSNLQYRAIVFMYRVLQQFQSCDGGFDYGVLS